jgi:hypothetical protein
MRPIPTMRVLTTLFCGSHPGIIQTESSLHTRAQTNNTQTKISNDNTVHFWDQSLLQVMEKKTTATPKNMSTTSKSTVLTPHKSILTTKICSNIGKPVIWFKAQKYQIYLRITKHEKLKDVKAITIEHTILKASQSQDASAEILTT